VALHILGFLLATFKKGTWKFYFSVFQLILGVYSPYLKKVLAKDFPRLADTRYKLTNVLFVVYLSSDGEMDGAAY